MNKAEINQHNQEKVIDSILEGKERMARIPYVKRLLFRWGSGGISPGTLCRLSSISKTIMWMLPDLAMI